jgi:hypothetical protein
MSAKCHQRTFVPPGCRIETRPRSSAACELVILLPVAAYAAGACLGRSSVMGLRALRKHRRVPAAVALMSVLLYSTLVTSHIVSEATHRELPAAGADSQEVMADDRGCHDAAPSATKESDPKRGHPAPQPRKCPFCTGYAAFHITVAAGSVYLLPLEPLAQPSGRSGGAQLVGSSALPFWHSRAPPTLS